MIHCCHRLPDCLKGLNWSYSPSDFYYSLLSFPDRLISTVFRSVNLVLSFWFHNDVPTTFVNFLRSFRHKYTPSIWSWFLGFQFFAHFGTRSMFFPIQFSSLNPPPSWRLWWHTYYFWASSLANTMYDKIFSGKQMTSLYRRPFSKTTHFLNTSKRFKTITSAPFGIWLIMTIPVPKMSVFEDTTKIWLTSRLFR